MNPTIDGAPAPAASSDAAVLQGGAGDDTLVADAGVLSLDGGAGNDLLIVDAAGPHTLTGGAGADTFEIAAVSRPGYGEDVIITDWSAGEKLNFDHYGYQDSRPQTFAELYARNYLDAETFANDRIMHGANHVAVQVGHDVVVFAETDGNRYDGADAAVVLVGKSLADVDFASFH